MEPLDVILDPWRLGISRRALLEVALLGAVCGPLGFWVLAERLSYGAESLSHGLLPGLVAGALLGAPPLAGAVAGAALAAALIAAARRDERIGSDTAIAVVVTGLLGLGALLAPAPEAPQRLEELLFGDPLAASRSDVAAAAAFALAAGLALAVLHRPLTASTFDPGGARSLGVRPGLARLGLLALLALTVAAASRGLGNLLALAIVVAPAVAVRRRASSPSRSMAAASAVAMGAGALGIYASFHLGTAAGASVALALCGTAVIGGVVPSRTPA